ncbi:MAG: hypothetical protein PHT19_14300 [Methylococcus sp.]|nr:hypothetical protein [Methylococcus sp.]
MLGKPQGIFDLHNSDEFVGSFITRNDVKEIFGVDDYDIELLEFEAFNKLEVIDELKLRKAWYDGKIKNAPAIKNSSLDELILLAIIRKTLPKCEVERQIKINRFAIDLKITHNGKVIYVEFDGPSHFSISRYGVPRHEPFRKKKMIEDKTGIEVINWAYWILRCSSNVKALFDENIKGYGALWGAKIHFGDFYFGNSADIIESINKRFNVERNGGYGYFYGADTAGSNKPEHPVVEEIRNGKKSIQKLLPPGFANKNRWLPEKLLD